MEAVILIGLQAAGKSTFWRERFSGTHVRINRDTLVTRHREMAVVRMCLATGRPFVVDDTNVTAPERAAWIAPARAAGFRVAGYYFPPDPGACARRNEEREEGKVPRAAIFGTRKRLQPPSRAEGFDEIHAVRIDEAGRFVVDEWREED